MGETFRSTSQLCITVQRTGTSERNLFVLSTDTNANKALATNTQIHKHSFRVLF